jgi:hypothetical protein
MLGIGTGAGQLPRRVALIAGLLLAASAINYMDRQTLTSVSKRVMEEFSLTNEQYGTIEASFGYAFAYGSNYFIGTTYYFTSFSNDLNASEANEIKWSLYMLTTSLTAQLSCSGFVERSKMLVPICFSLFLSLVLSHTSIAVLALRLSRLSSAPSPVDISTGFPY